MRWCRPVPWGRRGTVPGAEKGRFGKKGVLSQITIFTVFGPPRGWLLGLNWLQIGARPGLDIPKGKLSARGRPWGPQVPRWGPLKTAIIPKITPKVGCNSTSKGARNANPGVFQVPWTPLSDLDQKIVIFRNHPTSPPLGIPGLALLCVEPGSRPCLTSLLGPPPSNNYLSLAVRLLLTCSRDESARATAQPLMIPTVGLVTAVTTAVNQPMIRRIPTRATSAFGQRI